MLGPNSPCTYDLAPRDHCARKHDVRGASRLTRRRGQFTLFFPFPPWGVGTFGSLGQSTRYPAAKSLSLGIKGDSWRTEPPWPPLHSPVTCSSSHHAPIHHPPCASSFSRYWWHRRCWMCHSTDGHAPGLRELYRVCRLPTRSLTSQY